MTPAEPFSGVIDGLDARTPAMLATILSTAGSTPRRAGTRMIITSDRIFGTIGGGELEWRTMAAARESMALHPCRTVGTERLRFPLGPSLGQCCGGFVEVELQRLDIGDRSSLQRLVDETRNGWPNLFIYGAGHVGQACARAMVTLSVHMTVIDQRLEPLEAMQSSDIRKVHCFAPVDIVTKAPRGSFHLVMTHDHALDFSITHALLERTDLAWIGLIGSETKRQRFDSRLRACGLAQDTLDRLVCPVGIAGIKSKEPAAIALSIAAQLQIVFEAHEVLSGASRTSSGHP